MHANIEFSAKDKVSLREVRLRNKSSKKCSAAYVTCNKQIFKKGGSNIWLRK